MSCCALECTNRTSKKSTLSFFRFPFGDPDRLDQWVLNIRRNTWTPNVSSRLCSAHFESHPFSTDSWGRRCLKNTAVPTIFYFTKEQQSGRRSRTLEGSCNASANGMSSPRERH
ncbi:THAP domain-containing protein 3-like [Pseudochaenichthys georgianus]|uniref:THAP domain-containing protein 3-like n=1 Tax=Pseudochaenichthys georgianus TaxID=52239 RepID=UPI0039C20F61